MAGKSLTQATSDLKNAFPSAGFPNFAVGRMIDEIMQKANIRLNIEHNRILA